MNIIICGAGRVGQGIARKLASEKNEVTVVDLSSDLIREISNDLDVRGIVGHGSHPGILKMAGAESADMIIAATHSDEVNMIACQICHSLFGTPTKVARVRAQNYLEDQWRDLYSRDNMPIDIIISPEIEIGKAIMRRLNAPGAFTVVPFCNGLIQCIGIKIPEHCPIINMPISQIQGIFPDLAARLVGIGREGHLFTPRPEDTLEPGNNAYFVAESAHVARLYDILGLREEKARHIVIIGGGNIGAYVAHALEKVSGVRVRVIERDLTRAESLAENLRRTVVLSGDAMKAELQDEAGVRDAQTVLCLTDDDKTNILSGVLAKSLGAGQIFSLINESSFLDLKDSLDIDYIIDPRATTVSSILTHVRKGRILDVFSLEDGGEIVEGEILDTSPLAGKAVEELSLPDGIAMGAVLRDGDPITITDRLMLKARDRIVILAEKDAHKHVEQLFRVSAYYA